MTFKSTNNGLSSLILFVFLLTGCFFDLNGQNCNIPTNVVSGNITPTTATFNWDAMPNATAYEVNYRPMNAPATQPWNTVAAPTNTATINALTPSTMYDVQVRSACGSDFSDYTVTTSFSTQNCVPPMNPAISNITANSADIQWTAVPGASGYQLLHRIAVSGGNPGAWNATAVTGNNYTLTGLVTNTLYAGRLMTNCGGFPSDTSKVFYFSTNPCSVPAHLLITAQTASSVSLSWDAVPNANQYNVQYRTAGNGTWSTVNTNTNSRTINSLTGNTAYEFRVRSNCGGGVTSAYTLIINGFTLPCAMPENAVISNVAVNSATVSWNNATGANQYRVDYREALAPTWTTINANNTTKTINNLQPNTAYEVQVRSRCSGNQYSANTETLTFQTKSCTVPQNFQATNIQYTSAQLGWNAVENATRYQLQYRLVGDTTWTTTNPDSTVRTINGLIPNSTYEARVRTKCANNVFSDYSPTITFSTTLCAVPQNLQITNVTFDQARFSWTAVPNATRYQVEYRVVGDTLWYNGTSDSAFKVLNNLNPGATYEARVRSRCANNVFSDWTWGILFETPACVAPRNIMGGYRSNTSVELVWDGSLTAQLYQIGYRLAGDTVWTHQVNSDSNRKVLNQLTLGNLYEVRVRSKCANGVFSDWVNGTVFHTEACAAPTNLQVVVLDSVRYRASWHGAGDSLIYVFSYSSDDLPNRIDLYTQDTSIIITHWNPCTRYDYRLYTACSPEQTSSFITGHYSTPEGTACEDHAPIGVFDYAVTWYNQSATYNVFHNDTDADNDSLYFDPLYPPVLEDSPGQIVVNGREITYIPDTTNYQNYALIVYTPFDGRKRGQKTYYYIEVNQILGGESSCNSCKNIIRNGDFETGPIPRTAYQGRQFVMLGPGANQRWLSANTWAARPNAITASTPDILDMRAPGCPTREYKNEYVGYNCFGQEWYCNKNVLPTGKRALRLNRQEAAFIDVRCLEPGDYSLSFNYWAGYDERFFTSNPPPPTIPQLRFSFRNDNNLALGDELSDQALAAAGALIIGRRNFTYSIDELMRSATINFTVTQNDLNRNLRYFCLENIFNEPRLSGINIRFSSTVIDDICIKKTVENMACVTLTASDPDCQNAKILITSNPAAQSFTIKTATSTITLPGGLEAILDIKPTETTTYTITAHYPGCNYNKTITKTVSPTLNLTVSGRDQLCPNSEDEISFSSDPPATFYTITTPTGTFTTDKDHAFFPINPSQTTTYTITAHLGNCSETETLTVHVPQISVAFNPQTVNTCSNSPITLTPSSVGQDVYYYTWTPATGLSNSGIRNPVFTPPGAGTYTYTLMVMNREQDPSCTATAQVTVTVRQAPTITVTAPTEPLCPGQTATLTATGSPQGGTYVWSHNLGSSPTVNVNPNQTTIYTVTYTQNGCFTTTTATVTVKKVNPTVNIPPLCFGQPVTIDLLPNTESPYTITWSISPEIEFSGQGTNHLTFTPTGLSYAIQARFIAEGCTVSVNQLVNVGNSPTVSASASPATVACQNRPVTLTASGTAFTYHWLLPDNQTQIGNPIIVVPEQTTTYTVIGTAANGCTTSAKVTVTVGHITIEEPKVDVCDRFNRRKFCIKSPNPNSNYVWQLVGNAENQYFLNGVTTGSCITVLTTDVTKPIQVSVSGFDDPCIHTQEFPASFPTGEVILANLGITTSEDLIAYYGVNNNTITPQVLGGAGTIIIKGKFFIDSEELTFKDLNIVVRPDDNGEMGGIVYNIADNIYYPSHFDLNIYRCYIHSDLIPYQANGNEANGIQGMNRWLGIRSFTKGKILLAFVDKSQIEHAEVGIGPDFGANETPPVNIIARTTCLNQNEIHLYPKGPPLPGQLFRDDLNINPDAILGWESDLVLSACRLDCNAPLPATSNDYTNIGVFSGSRMTNVGSPFIGVNNTLIWETARNIFTRMSCGINLSNSFDPFQFPHGNGGVTSHINNNDFFDLINTPDYPIKATAIFTSGGYYFTPKEEIGNHSFNKVFRHPQIPMDVTATGIHHAWEVGKILVQNNIFEGIITGVKLDNLANSQGTDVNLGLSQYVNILNNKFLSVKIGTDMSVSTPWSADLTDPFHNNNVDISFKNNTLEDIGNTGWSSSIIPAQGPNIFIENNGFHRPNVTGQFADIWCARASAADACSLTVRDNFINPQEGGQPSLNGIYVSGDHGANSVIADNVIRNIHGTTSIVNGEQGQPSSIQIPNSSGIVVQNAQNIQISNNVLVNPNPAQRATGIRLINSPNSTVSCNKIGEYNFGILGEGISPGSTLTSNVMRFDAGNDPNAYKHASAFTLYNSGDLGDQGSLSGSNFNMLSWCQSGTADCYGALSVNTAPQHDLFVRQYSTTDNNGLTYSDDNYAFGRDRANANIGQNTSPITVTPVNTGQPVNYCDGNNEHDWLSFIDATHPSQLESFATGNYHLALFEEEGKYMYRQYLLDTISKNPLLRLQSEVLDSFYTVSLLKNMGTVHRIKQSIAEGKNSTAEGLNDALVPQNKIEQNHKQVNSIYFDFTRRNLQLEAQQKANPKLRIEQKLIQQDSLKTVLKAEHYTALSQIAEQCPLKGGKAVYEARAFRFHMDNQFRIYKDDCREQPEAKIDSKIKSISSDARISIYPNPASETATLNYELQKNVKASVIVIDVTGRTLFSFPLTKDKGEYEFSVKDLSAGVYLIEVHLSNGEKMIQKLTVQD